MEILPSFINYILNNYSNFKILIMEILPSFINYILNNYSNFKILIMIAY